MASIPTGIPCIFLQIPAELRNLIYEYSLTEEHGVQCTIDKDPTIPPKLLRLGQSKNGDLEPEANQLKYVCRKLYHETKGLTLQYNELTFRGTEDFERFLQVCAPTWKTCLRNINIIEKPEFGQGLNDGILYMLAQSTSQPLYAFCLQYPAARVIIRQDRDIPERHYIWTYATLRQALRGDLGPAAVTLFCTKQQAELINTQSSHWGGELLGAVSRPLLDNLRIAPTAYFPEDSMHIKATQIAEAKKLFQEGC